MCVKALEEVRKRRSSLAVDGHGDPKNGGKKTLRASMYVRSTRMNVLPMYKVTHTHSAKIT